MKRTKIVCTLGPAVAGEDKIKELIKGGMNVARFNFSHGSHEEHLERYNHVRKASIDLKTPVAALLDTKGPEIRLKSFAQGKVMLEKGTTFTLTIDDVDGTASKASITYKNLPNDVKVGTVILLDDGLIELHVSKISGNDIICQVMNSGQISNNKGVNVPDTKLTMPFISEKDHADIVFGIQTGYDFIAASFTRNAGDIREIKKILADNNCTSIKIIAKIENAEGIQNLDEILEIADGVMVARGDMGVEIPLEEVPILQKLMIKKAYACGKHVITATQMLDSMMKNPRPTRAETTDVANAIFDGTSAIMLSGETAAGTYPIESVNTMTKIAKRTEKEVDYAKKFSDRVDYDSDKDITNAIGRATCTTAYDLSAVAIITVTESGHTARQISKFRPQVPIIGCTPSQSTYNQLALSWGVTPVLFDRATNTDDLLTSAVSVAKASGLVKDGDLVIITAGVPLGVVGSTNLIRVHIVGEKLSMH